MNCREAELQISAERDGALPEEGCAILAVHVAQCAACRRMRDDLAAAIDPWRVSNRQVRVPDAELEWQKLRRTIRGGAGVSATRARSRAAWFALPFAAAAIVAVTFFVNPTLSPLSRQPVNDGSNRVAKNAGAASENESTVVFVDDKSGWTFVWATDDSSHHI